MACCERHEALGHTDGACGTITGDDCAAIVSASADVPGAAAAIAGLARCVVVLSDELTRMDAQLSDARADLARLRRAVDRMDDAYTEAYHYPVVVASVVETARRCRHTVESAETLEVYRCTRPDLHMGEHTFDGIPERVN